MNSFGRIFRVSLSGESHGPSIGVMVDGCPAGIPLSEADFALDLARRNPAARGTTPRKEKDLPHLESGVFEGHTTGAPILIRFENRDTDSSAYAALRNTPRPGHADFVGKKKFSGFNDYRGGGHFSGRLTVALVAAGVVAKKTLPGVVIEASLVEAGGSREIDAAIDTALRNHDAIGGIVECQVSGLPVGLGEPFFDSVESLLSHAVFAVPGVIGIEFGAGFTATRIPGSELRDELLDTAGKTRTNNSGGVNGGITNGNPLVFRVAVKPPSSVPKPVRTVSLESGEPVELTVSGRHDACFAVRVPVILEAVTAIVLADLARIDQQASRHLF